MSKPHGADPHVVLGLTEEEFDRLLYADRRSGGSGVPVTLDPRWHGHPVLGISGHAHSAVEEARSPHVHCPTVEWDHTPIPVTNSVRWEG